MGKVRSFTGVLPTAIDGSKFSKLKKWRMPSGRAMVAKAQTCSYIGRAWFGLRRPSIVSWRRFRASHCRWLTLFSVRRASISCSSRPQTPRQRTPDDDFRFRFRIRDSYHVTRSRRLFTLWMIASQLRDVEFLTTVVPLPHRHHGKRFDLTLSINCRYYNIPNNNNNNNNQGRMAYICASTEWGGLLRHEKEFSLLKWWIIWVHSEWQRRLQ